MAAQKKAEAKKKGERAPKLKQVKYGPEGGPLGLTGDRTAGNMLEQSLPFLVSLWLHALVVSPDTAAYYGWLWLAFRSFYPIVYRLGVPFLFLSTAPGYVLIALLLYPACM